MTPEIRFRARNKGPLSPRGGGPSHRSDSLLTKRAGRESPRDARTGGRGRSHGRGEPPGENLSLIHIYPVDRDGVIAGLDLLKEANIPIFGFDTEVADMSYLVSYAGSDNYNAGYVCGVDLVEKCPDGGDIIVLDSPTMQSVVDRTDGFLAALEELAPGKFNVVAQIDSMGNQEQGNLNGTDALTANPDAIAIFGGNDPTALGAYAAAEAAGSDALIYGVDGSPDVKALVAEGGITGTGAQSPINIGKTIAEVYYQWLAGEEVEERYPIETFMINADNVAEYGTDGWQ